MRILLVEDDASILQVLKLYICDRLKNSVCESADTLQKAMALVAVNHYDLILLDLVLPGEAGTPLIKYARTRWIDCPPVIVVMSAMTGAAKVAEQEKAEGYLEKPFTFENMEEIVIKRIQH